MSHASHGMHAMEGVSLPWEVPVRGMTQRLVSGGMTSAVTSYGPVAIGGRRFASTPIAATGRPTGQPTAARRLSLSEDMVAITAVGS